MREARLFNTGGSQAVRLPKEFRLAGKAVYIRRLGNVILLIPKRKPWETLVQACRKFTPDFMARRAQRAHEREGLFS